MTLTFENDYVVSRWPARQISGLLVT